MNFCDVMMVNGGDELILVRSVDVIGVVNGKLGL
jgi:hypothetical protein